MTEDTDKLAAQMRNLQPSKGSRESGMEAAMAAFGKEFAADTAAVSADLEKNSNSTQGSTDAARPTGKSTTTVRATSRRVETMLRFKNAFNFKPQTMMMAGTCSAALIAAMIVIPNMDEFSIEEPLVQVAAVEPVAENDSVKTTPPVGRDEPTASKAELDGELQPGNPLPQPSVESPGSAPSPLAKADEVVVTTGNRAASTPEPEAPAVAPKSKGGIGSVDSLLSEIRTNSSKVESENRAREAQFRQRASQQSALLAQTPSDQEIAEALQRVTGVTIKKENGSGKYVVVNGAAADLSNVTLNGVALTNSDGSMPSAPTEPLVTKFGNLTLEQAPAEFKTVTETIVMQEASTELVTIPATYETIVETMVVQEASKAFKVIPPKYKWVKGEIEGSAIEYKAKAAQYETVSETVVVQAASIELVAIPPTYETVTETVVVQPQYVAGDGSIVPPLTKQVSRRVVKTPASTQERTIPAVTKTQSRRIVKTPAATIETSVPYKKRNGKTRVPVKPASVVEYSIPAVTKQVSRRVIKTPARTTERVRPAVPQTYERQVLVQSPKFYLRDEDGKVVREFESRDAFEKYKLNTTTVVAETPVSTFSVDVDTASYSFLRASVNRGQLPPRSAIRLEEMINYFPYDYEAPKSADEPFKANVTVTPNPWNVDTKLMHIGIKGYVPTQVEKPRSNLVFLIDTSGSMNQANKLPLLINSFKLLLNTLDEDDTVSIVAYASASGTVLEPTAVSNKDEILSALNNLRAGGSTAGAAGLELAYQKAQESFDDEGVNRVILATDGDFNVGFSSPDDMKTFIKEKRETGIFLSVLGFGMGNYNDHLMQSLAQNGNGVAAYIDNLSEANKVLANEAGSALITIAKDVKIQVEFNPSTVAEYRLIGYETRALKRQDFNNDKVDAGEIGAGHSVTAIYEMTPVGSPAITVDKLRYVSNEDKLKSTGSDEYAFVKIRHKLPNADKSTLQTFPIGKRQERSMRRASDDMRFATAVAAVGQKLRGDTHLDDFSYQEVIELASNAKGEDKNGYRSEFIQMVRLIDTMAK